MGHAASGLMGYLFSELENSAKAETKIDNRGIYTVRALEEVVEYRLTWVPCLTVGFSIFSEPGQCRNR